jgi:glycosyltransferase involved in cell wall biosynthesis
MRILTVCNNLDRGGTERVAQNFTLAYARAGHAVAVLPYLAGGMRRQVIERAGIPVFEGGATLEQALRQADAFKPDVIHIHRPGVRNDQENEILKRLRRPDRRVIETNVFARVDYSEGASLIDVHMHLSDWSLWRWRRWLGSESHRHVGVVVPNAVETRDFNRASDEACRAFRESIGVPADAYLCGRVGQALGAKWHPQIITAFEAVAQADPQAHLVMIGVPRELRSRLQAVPAAVQARIHELPLTNSDAELAALYSSLDCFLHAAYSGESFGMVFTEAMLCGCPVVTAARPYKDNSQVIVVNHLQNGVVAGSVKGLPQAALRMRSDDALRRRCAAAARQSVLSRYDADLVAVNAIRAAEAALEGGDASQIQARLSDRGFRTDTPSSEIMALLNNTIGGPDPREVAAMVVLHRPWVHQMVYQYLKFSVYRKLAKVK